MTIRTRLTVLLFSLAFLLMAAIPAMASAKNTMTPAQAQELVQPFYDFFGGTATEAEVRPAFSPDWISFWGNGEKDFRTLDQTLGFFGGPVREAIPDLKWEIKEVLVTPDNRIIVRGQGTGTPVGGNLMGYPAADGKSFKLLSIDIHTVENGRIVKSYHVEDWFTAFKQVAPK